MEGNRRLRVLPARGVVLTTIGLAIPSIPPRAELLARALNSVCSQERMPDAISVIIDHHHQGAAVTRNQAWRALEGCDLIAFLDDDDELLPHHLAALEQCQAETGADLVYPWFTVVGGSDPFPPHFATDPWDPANPRQTTITCLWRRGALLAIDGFPEHGRPGDPHDDGHGNFAGEDYRAVVDLNELGGRIVHLADRTWLWHHHGRNTSGRGDRW